MSKKNIIFIACKEANHTCNKTQYDDASFLEKIKLKIHLLYCRACRKYSRNNAKLTEIINSSEVDFLKASEKETLKSSFEKELSKHD